MEKAAAGAWDKSGLKSAIVTVGHLLQSEYHLLQELRQDAIFDIFFDAAVYCKGFNHAVPDLFRPRRPEHDPKQIRTHTMVLAAWLGEYEVVQSFLSQGADPNDRSSYFGCPLPLAARRGHPRVVKALLEKELDLRSRGLRREMDLMCKAMAAAARAGHEDVIRILTEPKYKQLVTPETYHVALDISVKSKQVSMFLLLDRAAVDQPLFLRENLLKTAATNGCLPLVKTMVERELELRGFNAERYNMVELAARGGHEEAVLYLLASAAKQDGPQRTLEDVGRYDRAFTTAAANGHLGTVKILLQHGVDINSRCWIGFHRTTPLHEAAKHNRVETVHFLIEKGAVLDVMQDDMMVFSGHNALEHAIMRGHKEMVQILAEGGVDVKRAAPDKIENEAPPIILAKMWSQDDIVALLLDLGVEDVDPLKTRWADEFRRGVYPKSSWTLRKGRHENDAWINELPTHGSNISGQFDITVRYRTVRQTTK